MLRAGRTRSWGKVLALCVGAIAAVAVVSPASSAPGASPGQLFAFGDNFYGQLGTTTHNGTGEPNPTPALVTLPGANGIVVRAAAGFVHTLALTSTGQLYAFGENGHGQLGVPKNSGFGNPNPQPAPVTLPGASAPVVQVAAGEYHSLAATASGQLYSFGLNREGQLGRATHSGTSEPTPEPGLVTLPGASGPVVEIAAGASDGFAVTSGGQLYSFGINTFGELGYAKNVLTFAPNPEPALVTLPGATGPVTQVAAGDSHTLVLTASGQLFSFGENGAGQLGYATNSGTEEPNQVPTAVSLPGAIGPVVQIAAGGSHSLAVTASGQLYTFGFNRYGELGRAMHSGTSEPTPEPGLVTLPGATGPVVQVSADANSSFALTASGQLYSFGEDRFGQLGNTASDSEPHPIPALVALPAGATADTVAQGSTAIHALAIVADLSVVGTSLPTGAVGSPYAARVEAIGGAPPYHWTAAGLPLGLSIDPASAAISGTPSSTGPVCMTVPCPQPTPTVSEPTFTVTDSDGVQASAQLPITIIASSASGPPRPSITNAHESASRWREGGKLPRISRRNKLPVGTTFSFTLNEAASVTFRFARQLNGRKEGRRCVAETRKNHRHRPCTRSSSAGQLAFPGHAGTNKVAFDGRLSRSRKLSPGRYLMTLNATDSLGRRAGPVSLRFTIAK